MDNNIFNNRNTVQTQNLNISENNNQPNAYKDNKRPGKKKILIILVILIVIGSLLYLTFNKKTSTNKDKTPKPSSMEMTGHEVDTELDLAGIFYNDVSEDDESFSLNSNTRAVIKNNKIYFSYSPSYCSIFNSEETSDNQESLIKSKNSLCDKYDKEKNKNYEELSYIYLISSNIDGTEMMEISKFDDKNPIYFDYFDDKIGFYTSITNNTTYKLDLSTNKSTIFYNGKNNSNPFVKPEIPTVAGYPLSNKKNIALFIQKSIHFSAQRLDYFDYQTLTKTSTLNLEDMHDNLKQDKYEIENVYMTSSSDINPNLEEGSSAVYKNDKLIYKLSNINYIAEIFTTQNYIYIFGADPDMNIKTIKLNKKTYKEEKFDNNLDIKDFDDFSYIATGNNGKVYLYYDDGIYSFSEKEEKLTRIMKVEFSLSNGINENYLHVYNPDKENLILYNTEKNKILKLKNVLYYYFDNNKLYVVTKVGSKVKLEYYDL